MSESTLTRLEQAKLFQMLGGDEQIRRMIAHQPELSVKFPEVTGGHNLVYLNQIVAASNGDEAALDDVLKDRKRIRLEEVIAVLFNKQRFRIPPERLKHAYKDPNRSFKSIQPKANYAQWLDRLERHLKVTLMIGSTEFEDRHQELLELLQQDEQLSKLAPIVGEPCPGLPIVLTPLPKKGFNYGQVTEKYVTAAASSYQEVFSGRRFTNYREGGLAGKVKIVEKTHRKVIKRLRDGETIVAIYFPNTLQGYSVLAQREQMAGLPGTLALCGAIDTAGGAIMHPDTLFWDFQTPGLDCSAVQWQDPPYSLNFRANDREADFDYKGGLGLALGRYSGGFLFLKQCLEKQGPFF